MQNFLKKVPWGILAGAFAIATFYLTFGVIVSYLIVDSIAMQTNVHATLFTEWWLGLMFIADIACAAATLGSFVARIIIKPNKIKEKQGEN